MYRVADVELDATILLGRHLSHHAVTHSARELASQHRGNPTSICGESVKLCMPSPFAL